MEMFSESYGYIPPDNLVDEKSHILFRSEATVTPDFGKNHIPDTPLLVIADCRLI